MTDGLECLYNKNIQEAFDVIGYPASQQTFGTQKVYYWSAASHTGAIIPMSGMYFYGSGYCDIQIATTPDGKIIHTQWDGNPMGCRRYIRKLNHYYSQFCSNNSWKISRE